MFEAGKRSSRGTAFVCKQRDDLTIVSKTDFTGKIV